MDNTENFVSRCLVELLERHGITDAVVSPGSRNAPLLVALSRSEITKTTVVIDERSAAFVALGIASVSGNPVAIVCTSGTALLNYAPAVAEAYYRRIPLIVVSADRPEEWIDQDDSQTLWQHGALSNYVKRSYDIPAYDTPENRWYANRIINDAILCATSGRTAPVHINVQLRAPLGSMTCNKLPQQRIINTVFPRTDLTVERSRELGRLIASPRKVMIVCGFHHPDKVLNSAINKLSKMPNIVVLTETLANLHGSDFIPAIDATLAVMGEQERQNMAPDVVITMGGALVSRHIKQYLRDIRPSEHWHVGITETTIDCFQSLTTRIEMEPSVFFRQLASAVQPHREACDYANRWIQVRDRAYATLQGYAAKAPWSDMKAFSTFLPMIPRRWNVQYSNGTAIRYAQLFGNHDYHRCDCNRGVSGIDGCTSTAIGASVAYTSDVTLLITGDMSAQYDIGALACQAITPRFKMIVMLNGGGGIFRFVESTRNLDTLEDFFCVGGNMPLKELAAGYGFSYYEANDETQLRNVFRSFVSDDSKPAILAITTPPKDSACVLRRFFELNK